MVSRKDTGVDLITPKLALDILFIAFWMLSLMKPCPLQVTSAPYISVDPTIASCRCLADRGGTPFRLINEVNRASAFLALAAEMLVFSLKLGLESIHIPSHLVQGVARMRCGSKKLWLDKFALLIRRTSDLCTPF